jgi:hypothetical protein
MSTSKKSTKIATAKSNSTTTVSIQLPGVDNTQVIASQPYLIKENSSKPKYPENKVDKSSL